MSCENLFSIIRICREKRIPLNLDGYEFEDLVLTLSIAKAERLANLYEGSELILSYKNKIWTIDTIML